MTPPDFWQRDGILPRVLSPVAAIVAWRTARRSARPGWTAPVPVICCGNAGVGGAGKTTVALDLAGRLRSRGVAVGCISRGYGGRARDVLQVDPKGHGADLVGDEPLLLASVAPTWVGADRAAAARAAIAAGREALIMDDGLQNPGLVKTASLLVVDGAVGFGNGRVLPAGPLRETVEAAAARCRVCVLIGPDRAEVAQRLRGLPILQASLVAGVRLNGARVFAFCGIARPSKFFDSLNEAGGDVVGYETFADHHRFSEAELTKVLRAAERLDARPITTAKDAVRLPAAIRAEVDTLPIRLEWEDAAAIERLLDDVLR